VQIAGSSIVSASYHLIDLAKQRAADLLEAAVDDIVLDRDAGAFHVAGTPSVRRDWAELATSADSEGSKLLGQVDYKPQGVTFPFGSHVAVVEVDRETGHVLLQRLVAVDDAGTIVNPMLLEGQIHGGAASGAGLALIEEFRYDADGNPITSNLADYGFPSAAELPSFEVEEHVTVTPNNLLGAKGIGESGTIGATPAVQNAVVDALAHLGVRHIDLPCTPERVWRAITAATAANGD
jgi:carbon-monoxide dehydrogenase large subunit